MDKIQTLLDNKSFEVEGLLRKHKIAGPLHIDTIKKAYDAKGEPFMMELLAIITPTSSFLGIGKGNGFLGLGKSTAGFVYDPLADPLSDETFEAASNTSATEAASTGKGWTFFDNLLNLATKTGSTIGSVKNDVSGQANADALYLAQQNASNSNMLYIVAAGFIALIIIILILKK